MPGPQSPSLSQTPCPCEACKKRRKNEACNCKRDLFSCETQQRNDCREENDNCYQSNTGIRALKHVKEVVLILLYLAIMALCVLGILICYAIELSTKLYQSKNRLQIIAFIGVGIIAIYMMRISTLGRSEKKCPMVKVCQKFVKNSLETIKANNIPKKYASNIAHNHGRLRAGELAMRRIIWPKGKLTNKVEIVKPTVSEVQENRARDIMKKLKLYSIPLEMKRPPQFIVYLVDYFQQ